MGNAVQLREDVTEDQLLREARAARDPQQAKRLLALAAVRRGESREEAARIGGMTRQTLRDWVHRYNKGGAEGLLNIPSPGPAPKLSEAQLQELREIVDAGPDLEKDGVVRWRCVDLVRVIQQRFGVTYHYNSIGRLLKELGFSHVSGRPAHPKQDRQKIDDYKKSSWIR